MKTYEELHEEAHSILSAVADKIKSECAIETFEDGHVSALSCLVDSYARLFVEVK